MLSINTMTNVLKTLLEYSVHLLHEYCRGISVTKRHYHKLVVAPSFDTTFPKNESCRSQNSHLKKLMYNLFSLKNVRTFERCR